MAPMKFKVKDKEHSFEIQMWLLTNSCFWPGDVQKPFMLSSKYLFVDEDGMISHCNNDSIYEAHQGKEIDF